MPSVAHFASKRADLLVIEQTSTPIYDSGRQIGTKPGRLHQFSDHRIRVEGQKTIDFLRGRAHAPDGPEIWEIDASDVPSSTELLVELATADVARVREILEAESEGPQRVEIVETCRKVLEKMGAAERGPGGSVKAA